MLQDTYHRYTHGPTEIQPGMQPPETGRRQVRARGACVVCHRRKVRCNMGIVGVPCSNCFQDDTECILHVPNRSRPKRIRKESAGNAPVHVAVDPNPPGGARETPAAPLDSPIPTTADLPRSPEPTVEDQDEHVEWAQYLARPVEHEPHLAPVFVEDYLRSWGFTADVVQGFTQPHGPHLWVPQRAQKPLTDAELAFLEAKGAFNLPSDGFRETLLEAYFAYVHPLLPVVEMISFWREYELHQPRNVSLLLLQCMFLAASSYLPSDVCRANGFLSAATLKEVFYGRAKVLFDVGFEQDKICLVQSSLLLTLWYGNADDIAVCWHWIGTAISLCQGMGLHRRPTRRQVPEFRRRLWRRLWWSCLYRDRWIALGLGRPMRINPRDCDVEALTVPDLVEEVFSCAGLSTTAVRTVEAYRPVAQLFVEAVNLSVCLGEVMDSSQSLVDYSTITQMQSAEYERKISNWYAGLAPTLKVDFSQHFVEESDTWTLQKHILSVFYQAVTIALYRPRLSHLYEASSNQAILKEAREKCWAAASAVTDSLRYLIDRDMIANLPPEMSTILVIITSVLFTQRFWTSGLKQDAVAQKLELCLMVMKELADKYWAARSSLAYFRVAFRKMESELAHTTHELPVATPPITQMTLTPQSLGAGIGVSTSVGGFPSPSRWLYDLDTILAAGGLSFADSILS